MRSDAVNHPAVLPQTPSREQIERLEVYLLQAEADGNGVELPTWHHFADGLVARTILIRAGTVLTGAAHKSEHLNIASGDITVWTEAGMKRLTGYHVLPSAPGAKRVGLAHADTHWTTVHTNPDNCTDVTVLEDRLTDEAHKLQSRRIEIGNTTFRTAEHLDFDAFMRETGIRPDVLQAAMEITDDLVTTPDCYTSLRRGPSVIHGVGLFATRRINGGEWIAPMQSGGLRAVAGRWVNHSHAPNALMIRSDAGLELIASRAIDPGDEVTIDYRQALRANPVFGRLQ